MRWFFLILLLFSVTVVAAIGRRGDKFTAPPIEIFPDMDRQEKIKYQKPSDMFADGQGARKPVAGTVPIGFELPEGDKRAADGTAVSSYGFTHGDDYYNSGRFGDFYGAGFPAEITVDAALLARGRQRFDINCSPCHGASGNGAGTVSNFWVGFPPTANLLADPAKALPEGQIFSTITHGKGLMGPYNGIITVSDRWAIVAYVRALQFGSSAKYEGEVKTTFDTLQSPPEGDVEADAK